MKRPPMDEIVMLLLSHTFRCANESELQGAMKTVLTTASLTYEREARLSPSDRVDFLTAGGVALELKVKTDGKSLLRQVSRYAASPRVTAVIVAATCHHGGALPGTINGKTVRYVQLRTF